ncbi:hypothetical protein A2223_03605 [Candidatus Falkowbacteria bacterium RIFOXYA2_FULL_35_8]|uniref:Uncharacterized protein n=1 Tax=Candidatus Falkowbacteria bacterium RIFOXYC2_FULL_36_12 TaxID=1798002 RepID=A0A1F5SW22_9BACT|nr:MAG: hypothetical protein A2478_00470 [Candidatus Falkowbacteria bacterium RIFOXYC2_FULL_36_12]OGF33611.1 MAG: hypothetical protein A2223_03605 [Candidatus Falkowbacteria bacterium RIFOXYA2_FULL_35_8]
MREDDNMPHGPRFVRKIANETIVILVLFSDDIIAFTINNGQIERLSRKTNQSEPESEQDFLKRAIAHCDSLLSVHNIEPEHEQFLQTAFIQV